MDINPETLLSLAILIAKNANNGSDSMAILISRTLAALAFESKTTILSNQDTSEWFKLLGTFQQKREDFFSFRDRARTFNGSVTTESLLGKGIELVQQPQTEKFGTVLLALADSVDYFSGYVQVKHFNHILTATQIDILKENISRYSDFIECSYNNLFRADLARHSDFSIIQSNPAENHFTLAPVGAA